MTTDCYHTARGKTAFQILITEDRQICLLQVSGRICNFDLLTSLASWPAEKDNKSHLKVKSDSLGPCPFQVLIASTERRSTTALCCSTTLLGRFFAVSPASISSGAAHYCFRFMLCCAPLREGGFHLLHSSPSSSSLQHLESLLFTTGSCKMTVWQQNEKLPAAESNGRGKNGWTTPAWSKTNKTTQGTGRYHTWGKGYVGNSSWSKNVRGQWE